MVKNKFNRAIHNELLCTSMENRLTVITHFLCKKGIYINNNNKHKAIYKMKKYNFLFYDEQIK